VNALIIGDLLLHGTFPVHSVFRDVVNFLAGDVVVSVVRECVGPGPASIVLASAEFDLFVQEGGALRALEISGASFPGAGVYDSRLDGMTCAEGGAAASALGRLLDRDASGESVWAILQGREEKGGFFGAYAQELRAGVEFLREGAFECGVRLLGGLGIGLTPSGDDFLCGFLAGLHVASGPEGAFGAASAAVRVAMTGREPLARTLLGFACEARVNGHEKALLGAICRGGGFEQELALVLGHGATSGADYCSGLWAGLAHDR